jgi:hypothetical protein
MLLLRIVSWLADFIVASFIWAVVIALARPSRPVYIDRVLRIRDLLNTMVFMFYLPLVPGLRVDMGFEVPVGRLFLCVLIAILSKWIGFALLRRVIHGS